MFDFNPLQFVKMGIVTAMVYIINEVRTFLEKKNIKFKNDDTWFWVVVGLGIIPALISEGMDGLFSHFKISVFISDVIVYAAGMGFVYKAWNIKGKPGSTESIQQTNNKDVPPEGEGK